MWRAVQKQEQILEEMWHTIGKIVSIKRDMTYHQKNKNKYWKGCNILIKMKTNIGRLYFPFCMDRAQVNVNRLVTTRLCERDIKTVGKI